MFSAGSQKQQVCLLFLVQIVVIVLLSVLTTYGPEANSNLLKSQAGDHDGRPAARPNEDSLRIYPMYQDVHVMIWIGFGFLMTYLRRYGQSSVGLTFLVGVILVQVAMICDGVMNIEQGNKAYLSLKRLVAV